MSPGSQVYQWGFCLGVVLITGLEAQRSQEIRDDDLVRQIAIAQANAEYGLTQGLKPKVFRNVDFSVEQLAAHDSVRLYRAVVQLSENRHPYTVMLVGHRVLTLGGFAAPELVLASALWHTLGLHSTPERRAYQLARLADRNGAREFVDPSTPDTVGEAMPVRRQWSAAVDSSWPSNGVASTDDGGVVVTFTVFSRAVQDYADGWDPTLYRMNFDSSGNLLAWASRSGSRFSAAKVGQ